jgi:[methyl-Co(III) methanol-specific corrinoid protein]:coenzyme M methyltransferase
MKREPAAVQEALSQLSMFLSQVGAAYRSAGADFITVHEMGGSPGFLGPARFEQFVFPAVKQLIADLPKPAVLSVCGNTNKSMHLLDLTGANAISVDQTNDPVASRAAMKNTLLFGNLDPVQTLAHGTPSEIQRAAQSALDTGVDALWPGCDLLLQTPPENLKSFNSSLP